MKLKFKLCILFLFILSFILFFNVNDVFAYDFQVNDTVYIIPDGIDNFLLGNYESGGYLLLVPSSPDAYFKISGENNKAYGIMCYLNSNLCPFDSYYLPSGTDFTSSNVSLTCNVTTNRTFKKSDPFIFSSFNVYDTNNDIFFQCPVQEEIQELIIPALVEAKEIPEVMIMILKMIIPVGLVILSTILVISLVKSVICRMK